MNSNKENSLKNDRPLKIYLGDLTYDTVTISAESMPLNIGYVAAYCKNNLVIMWKFRFSSTLTI